jgi:hypothetical protein
VLDYFEICADWLCGDCPPPPPKGASEPEIEEYYSKIGAMCADCFGEWADKFGIPLAP